MLAFGVMGMLLSLSIIGISLLLIGLILLQKNRGSGLSGAFGGVGGHSAFGTKTGDFLTWVTVGLVAVFLLLNIAGTFVFVPEKIKNKPAAVLLPEDTETSSGADSAAPANTGATTPQPIPANPQPISAPPVTPTGTTPSSSGGSTPPASN
ncbi:MAG: preprotein translocase subunit SecG [Planctomycetes bacterium]|nr:preprotein translocase subunit SecG [Planctomycetota bacterium]